MPGKNFVGLIAAVVLLIGFTAGAKAQSSQELLRGLGTRTVFVTTGDLRNQSFNLLVPSPNMSMVAEIREMLEQAGISLKSVNELTGSALQQAGKSDTLMILGTQDLAQPVLSFVFNEGSRFQIYTLEPEVTPIEVTITRSGWPDLGDGALVLPTSAGAGNIMIANGQNDFDIVFFPTGFEPQVRNLLTQAGIRFQKLSPITAEGLALLATPGHAALTILSDFQGPVLDGFVGLSPNIKLYLMEENPAGRIVPHLTMQVPPAILADAEIPEENLPVAPEQPQVETTIADANSQNSPSRDQAIVTGNQDVSEETSDVRAMSCDNWPSASEEWKALSPELVDACVASGLGLNGPANLDEITTTPLHVAVVVENLDVVRRLLEASVDPSSDDYPNAMSPLHLAVWNGHVDIVIALIEAGADVNQKAGPGQFFGAEGTPLHFVGGQEFGPRTAVIISRLLAAGADLKARDGDNYTPFETMRWHQQFRNFARSDDLYVLLNPETDAIEREQLFAAAEREVAREAEAAAQMAALAVATPTPVITECDRQAAHPTEDLIPGLGGVYFDDMDTRAAIAACEDAINEAPNEPRYHFQLGRAFEARGENVKAFRSYERAADMGFAPAVSNLANLFAEGKGVLPNLPEALRLRELAATSGHVRSLTDLGRMYRDGQAVAQNYAKAMELYQRAADADNASAMAEIGWLFERGLGVRRSLITARLWYECAADRGDEWARDAAEAMTEMRYNRCRSYGGNHYTCFEKQIDRQGEVKPCG